MNQPHRPQRSRPSAHTRPGMGEWWATATASADILRARQERRRRQAAGAKAMRPPGMLSFSPQVLIGLFTLASLLIILPAFALFGSSDVKASPAASTQPQIAQTSEPERVETTLILGGGSELTEAQAALSENTQAAEAETRAGWSEEFERYLADYEAEKLAAAKAAKQGGPKVAAADLGAYTSPSSFVSGPAAQTIGIGTGSATVNSCGLSAPSAMAAQIDRMHTHSSWTGKFPAAFGQVPGETTADQERRLNRQISKEELTILIADAGRVLGIPSDVVAQVTPNLLQMAKEESGMRPNMVQDAALRDGNEGYSNRARGLFQFVPGTFGSAHVPGYDNIFSPLDNTMAAMNAMHNATSMHATKGYTAIDGHGLWPKGGGWSPGYKNPYADCA